MSRAPYIVAAEARNAKRQRAQLEGDPIGTRAGAVLCDLHSEMLLCSYAMQAPALVLEHRARGRHCFSEKHRRILEAVERAHAKGLVSPRTILAELTRDHRVAQVGGVEGLREIFQAGAVPTLREVERRVARVIDLWKRRAHLEGMRRAAALLSIGAPRFDVAKALDEWLRAVEADGPELEATRAALEGIHVVRRAGTPAPVSLEYIRAAKAG